MTLFDKQVEFVKNLTRFFTWLELNGYEVTLGECWRSPETAKLYALEGKGIEKSLHCDRLAIDLQIFNRGVWLLTVDDLREVGTFWESMSVPPNFNLCWGGHFHTPDVFHFSLAHAGKE